MINLDQLVKNFDYSAFAVTYEEELETDHGVSSILDELVARADRLGDNSIDDYCCQRIVVFLIHRRKLWDRAHSAAQWRKDNPQKVVEWEAAHVALRE